MSTDTIARGLAIGALARANGAPYTRNLKPEYLQKWRTAYANARLGRSRAKLVFAGDSVTRGAEAGTGTGNLTNGRLCSGPTRLATVWTNMGIPVSEKSILGSGVTSSIADATTFDPRITFSGSPTLVAHSFGGALFALTAGQTVTFTVTTSDNLRLRWVSPNTAASFTYQVDALAVVPVTVTAAAGNNTSALVSPTLGTHTITFTGVTGTSYIIGVEVWDSTVPAVDIYNGGMYGSPTAFWADATATGFTERYILQAIAPNLTDIQLGINDWQNGVALATSAANLTTLVGFARVSGDVVFTVPPPTSGAASQATQTAYQQMMWGLSDSLQVPLFDFMARDTSYTVANAAGRRASIIHPNGPGYNDLWSWKAPILAGL